MVYDNILTFLKTEQTYKTQSQATFEALCWLFCVKVWSANNGHTTVEVKTTEPFM